MSLESFFQDGIKSEDYTMFDLLREIKEQIFLLLYYVRNGLDINDITNNINEQLNVTLDVLSINKTTNQMVRNGIIRFKKGYYYLTKDKRDQMKLFLNNVML